jgi:aldose 1-epimerase
MPPQSSAVQLALRNERVEVGVIPEIGAGITYFRAGGIDLFRSAADAAMEERDPLGLACFPMTPFVNRVANGRFRFDGVQVVLPSSRFAHALHGYGWLNAWKVEDASPSQVVMSWTEAGDAWPWRSRTTEIVDVRPDALVVTLLLENLDERAMPAALGLHPFYPHLEEAELEADVSGIWLTSEDLIPLAWRPAEGSSSMRLATTSLDNCFTGFDGVARIRWPRRHVEVIMEASGCRFLQVFTRSLDGSFCIEAQTAMPDALNQMSRLGPESTGIKVLAPGERLACTTRFLVKPSA